MLVRICVGLVGLGWLGLGLCCFSLVLYRVSCMVFSTVGIGRICRLGFVISRSFVRLLYRLGWVLVLLAGLGQGLSLLTVRVGLSWLDCMG